MNSYILHVLIMKKQYYVPCINEIELIFASLYTTKVCGDYLRLMFCKIDKFSADEELYVDFEEMEKIGEDWISKMNRLFVTTISAVDVSGKKVILHWLDKMVFDTEHRRFYFAFSKEIKHALYALHEEYTSDYCSITSFSNHYTFYLYQYLKRNHYELYLSSKEMRDLLNLEPDMYPLNAEIRRTILNRSVKEFKEYLGWNMMLVVYDGYFVMKKK